MPDHDTLCPCGDAGHAICQFCGHPAFWLLETGVACPCCAPEDDDGDHSPAAPAPSAIVFCRVR